MNNKLIYEIYTPCDGEETHETYNVNLIDEERLANEEEYQISPDDIIGGLSKYDVLGRLIVDGAKEVSVFLGNDKDSPKHKEVMKWIADKAGYKVVEEAFWENMVEGHVLFLERE